MALLSVVEIGPIIAHHFTCPTIVIFLLIHGTLASKILSLLVLLRSGGFELQGRLELRFLLAISEAGHLGPFLLPLSMRIELALAMIF